MREAPRPTDEKGRLAELYSLQILDTTPEERFDRITRVALRLFGVPIALVSLIDETRQWCKSCQGLSISETPRDVSFCGHAILEDHALLVEDAHLDSRFADNPLVNGEPYIRFYAGHPLRGPHGHKVGTLCIIDHLPRRMSREDMETLRDLAAWVESELNTTLLNTLLECLADGMVIFDQRGTIEFLNPAAAYLFGRETGELIGQDIETLIPGGCPKERVGDSCEYLPEMDRGCVGERRELEGIRRDGGSFPVEFAISEMHVGQRPRFIGIVHDLTKRKEAEGRLSLQAAALQAAANGIVITDPQGIIQWVNPAFTRLTGYEAQEANGQSTRLLKSGRQDPSYYRELWGTVTSGKVWHGELINRRKDGTHYIEEMTITPVLDDRGEIARFISIKQDVSARKDAEEKLRKAMAQLEVQYGEAERARSETRAILDATSEAMFLVSPDDRFLALNRQSELVFHTSAGELAGRRFAEVLPEVERIFEDPEGFKACVAHTGEDSERQFTETARQRWPVMRELELFSTPVRDAGGEHLGRLYVFRDVTHEREVDRMKSEFVSLVSHELRTPLTSIKGYVDLILDGDSGEINEEQREFLTVAKRNADRLTMLVGDLLDVSRIESGAMKLKLSEIDLKPLIQGVAGLLRPHMEMKKQTLNIDVPAGLPRVSGDADRIIQILTNLVSNANKYTPSGGSISVGAREEEGRISIQVSDTGVGLSLEEQSRLFTKFYRAENPKTQGVSGTGLGLWITRSLVEMHGGEIRVSSNPGKGTTFRFALPSSGTGADERSSSRD